MKTTTPKKIITSSGKEILILDGLYDMASRTNFYHFVINSRYSTKGYDNNLLETKGDTNLVCSFSQDDLSNMKFLSNRYSKQLEKYFNGFKVSQARLNLSTLNDKNRVHIDNQAPCKTLIYYPNMEWKIEWGGALLLTNDNLTEIDCAISYVPGRVIIMDGTIPHCIAAPTNLAPSYRFSLAIQYEAE